MSLYEDGVLIGTEKTQADLSVLKDANNALIGYGQFKNDILNGMVADFKIYDYAMTKEQVADKFEVPDDEKVKRDKEWRLYSLSCQHRQKLVRYQRMSTGRTNYRSRRYSI